MPATKRDFESRGGPASGAMIFTPLAILAQPELPRTPIPRGDWHSMNREPAHFCPLHGVLSWFEGRRPMRIHWIAWFFPVLLAAQIAAPPPVLRGVLLE